jgi:hypothetical protein
MEKEAAGLSEMLHCPKNKRSEAGGQCPLFLTQNLGPDVFWK